MYAYEPGPDWSSLSRLDRTPGAHGESNAQTTMIESIPVGLRQLLAAHEVDPPDWARNYRKRRGYCPGDCYRRAWNFANRFSDNGAKLVHGVAVGVGHAWVNLPGGLVYDGMLHAFFRESGYMAALQASTTATYTAKEAARLAIELKHFGPWNEVEE